MNTQPLRRPGSAVPERGGNMMLEPGGRDMPPIGAEIDKPGIRWDMMYNLFLRLAALVWLFKGVAYWGAVLGLGEIPFGDETPLRQALFIAFSLLDCCAGVGLWLLSPWGKSLWVFVVVAEIFLGVTKVDLFLTHRAAFGSASMLITFFILTFALRQRQLGKF